MAGVRPGRVMDGVSLLPAAEGKRRIPKRDILLQALRPLLKFPTPYTAYDLPFYGVRTHRFKYLHWSFDAVELYDLKNDPDELVNLADEPEWAGKVAELEAVAKRLSECRGSACR